MKTLDKILTKFEENVASFFYIVMLIDILYAVFMRYVMKDAFQAGEEIARYCMIWGVYIGVSTGTKKRAHLGIDMLVDRMPKKVKKIVTFCGDIVVLAIYMVLFATGCFLVIKTIQTGQRTPALQIPFYYVYLALPVGFGLSTLRVIINIWKDHFNKNKDVEEYEEVLVS